MTHACRAQGAGQAVDAAIGAALARHVQPGARVAVALSGGLDSMVLLDAMARFAARHPFVLSAIHVHHGLSPNADRWESFCAEQCAARKLRIVLHRVELRRERGRSLEALAREARYARLFEEDVDVVALAHHADDQAETLLLQLLRGAGPHGLAAMPPYRAGRPALLRPLLELPRALLAACAAERRLAWIEDESNDDRRYPRNAIRRDIAPALAAHFPGYPATILRAARHQADAAQLLDELAEQDAAGAADGDGLDRARLAALSPARARNLLRWFVRREGLRPPSDARLADMLRQLLGAAPDARVRIALDGAEIGRHRGRIAVHGSAPPAFERVWHGEAEIALPHGVFAFERTRGAGVAAAKLEHSLVALRSRAGGEHIRLAANRPTRAVKKLLQEAHVPPWERQSLPLLWSGEELVAVPGIGVALGFQAQPDEPSWRLEWRPLRTA